MKSLSLIVAAFACTFAFSACSKSSTSGGQTAADGSGRTLADSDGHCSSDVISTRNSLASAARAVMANPTVETCQDMIDQCLALKSYLGPKSCTALSQKVAQQQRSPTQARLAKLAIT